MLIGKLVLILSEDANGQTPNPDDCSAELAAAFSKLPNHRKKSLLPNDKVWVSAKKLNQKSNPSLENSYVFVQITSMALEGRLCGFVCGNFAGILSWDDNGVGDEIFVAQIENVAKTESSPEIKGLLELREKYPYRFMSLY